MIYAYTFKYILSMLLGIVIGYNASIYLNDIIAGFKYAKPEDKFQIIVAVVAVIILACFLACLIFSL